jgi:hypothetical protein
MVSRASKDNYLRDEYLLLQNQYEDYDKRSLTIKSWITAASIAGIALGFGKDGDVTALVWIVVASISACVWYLEARWKMFQYALRPRIKLIESYFRGEARAKNIDPFQAYDAWFEGYQSDSILEVVRDFVDAATQDFVFVPYLPIILICVSMYICMV